MKSKPATLSTVISSRLRNYLYATAAITGGSIMIVEILGARMLAPYFGTSHFVWTAQIAVTLVALAVGYYLGGKWVDRTQRPGRMYGAILAAGVYLAIAGGLCEQAAYACLGFSLAAGSLLASTALFFLPLCCLAMVGPFFIRLLTHSVGDVGGTAGRLTAIGTFGSFVGTLLIGYVLVPLFPNSRTMFGVAAILMALSAIYFIVWGRKVGALKTVLPVVLVVGALGAWMSRTVPWRGPNGHEIARANSHFGRLQVVEIRQPHLYFFLNDFLAQNVYDPDSGRSAASFSYMLHGLGRMYAGPATNVLCIGLGVGIVPMEFAREGANVDVVEINPDVVPLAERYFGFEPGKVHLYFGDGRYFLNRHAGPYDIIALDAFLGDSSPSHLMTREAFESMKRVLVPDGVLVINSFGSVQAGKDYFTASLDKTLKQVFSSVRLYEERGNLFFVASPSGLVKQMEPDFSRVHPMCLKEVIAAYDTVREPDPNHGRVLTDDFNPVEFYDSANREALRRKLAESMQAL